MRNRKEDLGKGMAVRDIDIHSDRVWNRNLGMRGKKKNRTDTQRFIRWTME